MTYLVFIFDEGEKDFMRFVAFSWNTKGIIKAPFQRIYFILSFMLILKQSSKYFQSVFFKCNPFFRYAMKYQYYTHLCIVVMILGGAPMHSLTVIINNAEQFTAYHLLTLISLKISFRQQYEKLVRREVFFFYKSC